MEPTPQAMPSRPACLPQERRGLRVRSRPSATSTHREAFTRDRQYQQRLAPLTDLSKPEQPHPLLPGCELPRIEGDRQRNHHPACQGIPRHPAQRRRTRLPRTDLNGRTGTQTVEGAEIIVRMAQISPDGPTGTYVSAHAPIPLVSRARARTRHTGVRARRTKSDNTRTHGRCDADQEDVKIVGRGPTLPA